jgi:hypothetical protein
MKKGRSPSVISMALCPISCSLQSNGIASTTTPGYREREGVLLAQILDWQSQALNGSLLARVAIVLESLVVRNDWATQ